MILKRTLVAAAAIAAINFAACTTITDRRTTAVGRKVDDASIIAAVKAKLASDPARTLTSIDVDSVSGTVYLNGTVKDANAKRRADALTRDVGGVKRVVNNLQVRSIAAGDAPAAD